MVKCEIRGNQNVRGCIQRRDHVNGNIWSIWIIMKQTTYMYWPTFTFVWHLFYFYDHSTRGQRRWDVIFLTFSLKSRKTISFKHSSTFSTSINYELFDIINTIPGKIDGWNIDSMTFEPYQAQYIYIYIPYSNYDVTLRTRILDINVYVTCFQIYIFNNAFAKPSFV